MKSTSPPIDPERPPLTAREAAASTLTSNARLTLSAAEAAGLLGICRAQGWKLHAAGKVPAPSYLGSKAPRGIRSELEEWLRAGAPDRQTWQRLRGDHR
jgi:predicted DNA-binding transcriptional regulator AlpA